MSLISMSIDLGSFDRKILSPVEVFLLQPESDLHQKNQHRNFNQRSDDSRESRARIDAENGDGDGDAEFKIVSGCRERQRCASRIIGMNFGIFVARTGFEQRLICLSNSYFYLLRLKNL